MKHTALAKGSIATLACGGLWTKTRQRESGYQLENDLCELCGLREVCVRL